MREKRVGGAPIISFPEHVVLIVVILVTTWYVHVYDITITISVGYRRVSTQSATNHLPKFKIQIKGSTCRPPAGYHYQYWQACCR